jgi:hypothetical protein
MHDRAQCVRLDIPSVRQRPRLTPHRPARVAFLQQPPPPLNGLGCAAAAAARHPSSSAAAAAAAGAVVVAWGGASAAIALIHWVCIFESGADAGVNNCDNEGRAKKGRENEFKKKGSESRKLLANENPFVV